METSFFDSDYFIVGYYILTVGASLLLIKDTKKRIRNLKIGRNSIKYAPISFGILVAYVLFVLLYMFLHINYFEERYFRKSKKMVIVWALIHIAMGIKIHMALVLIPIGFVFKYVYDKKGVQHSYAMHFATNILIVCMLFFSFVL